ncbi:MAG: helix-turn-helix domain-containing protein [Candidatus Marinimicrobia bacterium]|nr:helix-turn-helix domain-containing protein [Candidatus Neomarinimicrobiota bacterium]MCF7922030.1 helix-turn-helix domain-containing protein [Candidatus Neomarinimicrobiota bacterium]
MAFHEDLRNHRLKKGLILEEISEDIKINVRILQALEQGDYHILPVPYVRLFMKAYAQAIDYPVEDILRGLENELKLTGEQGVSGNISADLNGSMDMSGATFPEAQNLLQMEKGSQSNLVRLVGVIAALIIVIIIGKSLLQPDNEPGSKTDSSLLPPMNLTESLESMLISDSLLSANSDSITVTSTDFLSIIWAKGKNNTDTLFQEPGVSLKVLLTPTTELRLFPGEAALLSVKGDTLPGSPFSNSWLVVTADSTGGHLETYPTL